jgi:putative flippase GtrA
MESRTRISLLDRILDVVRDRALLLKATSFACIGVVNTLVDFGLFSLGHFYFGLPIVVANLISWTIAVTGSYVMNALITFAAESRRKLRLKAYLSFVAAQIAGFVADTTTVLAVVYLMPIVIGKIFAIEPALVGKVLGIGVSFLVNFSVSHFWIFRPLAAEPEDAR